MNHHKTDNLLLRLSFIEARINNLSENKFFLFAPFVCFQNQFQKQKYICLNLHLKFRKEFQERMFFYEENNDLLDSWFQVGHQVTLSGKISKQNNHKRWKKVGARL